MFFFFFVCCFFFFQEEDGIRFLIVSGLRSVVFPIEVGGFGERMLAWGQAWGLWIECGWVGVSVGGLG